MLKALRTSTISITIEQGLTNLPVVHDSFVSEKAKRGLGPHLCDTDYVGRASLFWIVSGGLTLLYPPSLLNQSKLSFLVSHVLVFHRMKI